MTSLVTGRDLCTPGRLQPTDIDFAGGSLTALVGPNGSGKTSLLHALAAIPPATGSTKVAGVAVRRQPPARRQRLLGLLTADRDVAWPIAGRDLLKLGSAPVSDCEEIVATLALVPLLDRRVDQLSSGERARLLLARILGSDPALLLLDEPLANLDPYWQLIVMELLRDRAARPDRAVVLAIHDLASATRFADRLLLMSGGAIAWGGPAGALHSSGRADQVFGARWTGADWQLSRSADPQSSR
jgi:iron complex transport system ATP-binding protein